MCMIDLAASWAAIYGMDLGRYLIAAGVAFGLLAVLLRRRLEPRRIQPRRPKAAQMRREFAFSMVSVSVFSLNGLFVHTMAQAGHFEIYADIGRYGWAYWALSLILIVVLHDAYFYWTHRLMHLPGIFRAFHLRHHRSRTPTPWTAYAFAPGEAVVHAVYLPLFLSLFAVHWSVPLVWVNHMILRNVIGHSGFELFPRRWLRWPVLRWITTVTHHDLHHSEGHMNYGFYFTWWDRLCGTEHPHYARRFAKAAHGGRPVDGTPDASVRPASALPSRQWDAPLG